MCVYVWAWYWRHPFREHFFLSVCDRMHRSMVWLKKKGNRLTYLRMHKAHSMYSCIITLTYECGAIVARYGTKHDTQWVHTMSKRPFIVSFWAICRKKAKYSTPPHIWVTTVHIYNQYWHTVPKSIWSLATLSKSMHRIAHYTVQTTFVQSKCIQIKYYRKRDRQFYWILSLIFTAWCCALIWGPNWDLCECVTVCKRFIRYAHCSLT